MKAMNGFGASRGCRGLRLLGCLAALVALSAMMISPSLASAKTKPIKQTYVGLGDSLAFGYSQELFNNNLKTGESPSAFEHGYVSDYHNLIDANGKTQLVNYGCPGETTESLIGDNPTFISELNAKAGSKVSEPITGEKPCAYHTTAKLPLHNEYGGKSQLEAALATIATDKAAGKPVKRISLDIGANDELHAVAKAEAEAKVKVEAEVNAIVHNLVFEHIEAEVAKQAKQQVEAYVFEHIIGQATEEAEKGEGTLEEDIAKDAAAYFAAHAAELEALGAQFGNEDLVKYPAEHAKELEQFGVEQAGIYVATHGAFLKELGEKYAVELIVAGIPALYAQIDTNVIGILTAIHDSGFRGRLIFVGTYDAYGRVAGVSTEHKELEPGFNALLAQLASLEQGTFTKKSTMVKVCYSNAEALFNPASVSDTPANEELEEKQMAEWTNMANFNVFEGKTYGQPGADGPDIHATPLGYEKMAEQMHTLCG